MPGTGPPVRWRGGGDRHEAICSNRGARHAAGHVCRSGDGVRGGGCAREVHHHRCARRDGHICEKCQRPPSGSRRLYRHPGRVPRVHRRRGVFTTVNDPHAGTASGQGTTVHAINDHGVLGGGYTDAHGVSHGLIDRRGVFTTVNDPHAGTAPGQGTLVNGLNNRGVLDGTYTDANGVFHGFIDRRGVFTTVNHAHAGTAPRQGTSVNGLNDRGAVTGFYFNSRGNPVSFAGRPGHFTTVTDPAAAPFSTLASKINDAGVIVGTTITAHAMAHGF